MLAWYQTVFEARVQYQNPALAFLTYDDEHHRFAIANLSLLLPDRWSSRSRDTPPAKRRTPSCTVRTSRPTP
jgi:hypothetical protein